MCALYGYKVLIFSGRVINSLFISQILTLIICNFCLNCSKLSHFCRMVYILQYASIQLDSQSFLGSDFQSWARFLPLLGYSHTKLIQSGLLSWSNFLTLSNSFLGFYSRLQLLISIIILAKAISYELFLLSLNNL